MSHIGRFANRLCFSGLVQPGPDILPGRVLRAVRRAGLLPAPVLPERPAGPRREGRHDRPHPDALQFRLLRQPRARQQVSARAPHGATTLALLTPQQQQDTRQKVHLSLSIYIYTEKIIYYAIYGISFTCVRTVRVGAREQILRAHSASPLLSLYQNYLMKK